MRRHLKNTFIPHEGNNHLPHLLSRVGLSVLLVVLIGAFGFSVLRGLVLNQRSEFTAAVLPAVLVALANEDRADNGLHELTTNPVLEEAARLKAEHMAAHGYFAHVSPDGLDPWYWFYRAGYEFSEAGENLAVNFTDSDDVERAWMDSPGHRANILSDRFTEIGIATAHGTYKGRKTVFVVQMFGNPATTHIATAPVDIFVPQEDPSTTLIKEETFARVEGARTESTPTPSAITPARVEGASVSFWDSAAARPRATVSWIFVGASLLVSLVLLSMVFMQVHHKHSRSIVYAILLLVIIVLLSYLNTVLLSGNLVIV